jgi:pyruvate dehydrogenase E1 component alpha subunit
MPGVVVDGMDVLAVYNATKEAVDRARAGKGPTLIEAKTYRHGGHHVNDPGLYMPKDELEAWKARDPIFVLRSHIKNDKKVKALEETVDQEIDAAIEFGKTSPPPSVDEFLASITDR